MAITYHPTAGAILLCDYETGFIKPEMVKRRACVVITPRLRRRDGLCTVVPLSTTEPDHIQDFHRRIAMNPELPAPWEGAEKWAKCDMLATVCYARLDRFRNGKDANGQRLYVSPHVAPAQLVEIRKGVLCALTLRELTAHM